MLFTTQYPRPLIILYIYPPKYILHMRRQRNVAGLSGIGHATHAAQVRSRCRHVLHLLSHHVKGLGNTLAQCCSHQGAIAAYFKLVMYAAGEVEDWATWYCEQCGIGRSENKMW